MATPILSCVEEVSGPAKTGASTLTIRCYFYSSIAVAPRLFLRLDRRLVVQAMTLLMRLDRELRFARADWNEDRFRRLMRLRRGAVKRLKRRWAKLDPEPRLALGSLRRRFHANVACHLRREID